MAGVLPWRSGPGRYAYAAGGAGECGGEPARVQGEDSRRGAESAEDLSLCAAMRRQVARVDLGGFAALFIALRSLRLCAEFLRVPGLLEGVKRMDDLEVKADAREGAFDAVLAAEAGDRKRTRLNSSH